MLTMKNTTDKIYGEIRTIFLRSVIFFENLTIHELLWKKKKIQLQVTI